MRAAPERKSLKYVDLAERLERLPGVAVEGPVTMPPVDHVPWLLGKGDIPLADWLACMTDALFTLPHWEAQIFPVGNSGASVGGTCEHEQNLEHQLTCTPFVRSNENILLTLMPDFSVVCSSGH